MIENARGLVLRTRRLTETSLIVSWLTSTAGRISTVAKGALRPKSPFRGKLDLFYLADIAFKRSRRSELHTLCELGLVATHPRLRQDLDALRQASYCAALLEQTTETDTPLPEMFELMLGLVSSFREKNNPPDACDPQRVLAFELRLLQLLGLEPNFDSHRVSEPTQDTVQALLPVDWPELQSLHVPAAQTVELRRFLHGFLVYNFGRLARGRDAALAGNY